VILLLALLAVNQCHGQGSVCFPAFITYYNASTSGLQRQFNLATEQACTDGCEDRADCWSLDFDFKDNTCWFGTTKNPVRRVNPTAVHKDKGVKCSDFSDCAEILKHEARAKSGVYTLKIACGRTVKVYCDMTTSGGGWTVFQRRKDGSVNFRRNWTEYANGFGDAAGEFWLGNDNLAAIVQEKRSVLRVDLVDYLGKPTYAEYNDFFILGAARKYKLDSAGTYSGNAGDSLVGHVGMMFTTIDQDNDAHAGGINCAVKYLGAWWHRACHTSNLNGEYGNNNFAEGISWADYYHSKKFSEMKLRPF